MSITTRMLSVFVLACVCGCSKSADSICWRMDTKSIIKRLPMLSACTNVLWHGEVITKDSFFSVPGPSAYRIVCFASNASQIMASAKLDAKGFHVAEDVSWLKNEEIKRLESNYGIRLQAETLLVSNELDSKLILPPYWGRCVYFKDKQLLCVMICGE